MKNYGLALGFFVTIPAILALIVGLTYADATTTFAGFVLLLIAIVLVQIGKKAYPAKKPQIETTCDECDGTGIFYFTGENKLADSQPCGRCKGTGKIKVDVNIA